MTSPIRTLHTASGAVYEVDESNSSRPMIRRLTNDPVTPTKRGDGDWQPLILPLPDRNVEGQSVMLVMASLDRYGPDDLHPGHVPATVTVRRTTPVVFDSFAHDNPTTSEHLEAP